MLSKESLSLQSYVTIVTDQCYQQKGTGCYSFNVTADVINPDHVDKIELWIYKQKDPNDHYQQVGLVLESVRAHYIEI